MFLYMMIEKALLVYWFLWVVVGYRNKKSSGFYIIQKEIISKVVLKK